MRRILTATLLAFFVLLGVQSLMAAIPTTQARFIGFSNITSTSATISWINGNGNRRMVVVKEATGWTHVPTGTLNTTFTSVTGPTNYLTASAANGAAFLGAGYTDGGAVVYNNNGTGRSVQVTNLTPGQTYYVMVIEYNLTGSGKDIKSTSSTNNPRSFTTQALQVDPPTAIAVTANSEGGLLTWTDAPGADGYIIDVQQTPGGPYLYQNFDIGKPEAPEAGKFWITGAAASTNYQVVMTSYGTNHEESTDAAPVAFTTTAAPAYTVTGYSDNAMHKIGQSFTTTFTTSPLQTGLTTFAGTINAANESATFVESAEGIYQLTHTVVTNETDVAVDAGTMVTNVILKDYNNVNGNAVIAFPNITLHSPGVDGHLPVGYTVTIDQGAYINDAEKAAVGFTFAGAEVGTTYNYTFSDVGNAHTATGTGVIGTATDNILGVDLTAFNDGLITLSVTLTDPAGNIGLPVTTTSIKDVVAPVITILSPVPSAPINGTQSLTFSIVDANGVTPTAKIGGGVLTAFTTGAFTNTLNGWGATPDGAATITVGCTDAAGNVAIDATVAVVKDIVAPTATDDVDGLWHNVAYHVTFTPDAGTGTPVTRIYYTTTGIAPNPATDPYVTSADSWAFLINSNLNQVVNYIVEDAAGNQSASIPSATAMFDNVGPAVTGGTGLFTAPIASTKWNAGAHNITWTAGNITDAFSGLGGTPITLDYYDGTAWTLIAANEANDGTYSWTVPAANLANAKVRIIATDNANNTTIQESAAFIIDNTAPVITSLAVNHPSVKVGTVETITFTVTEANPIVHPTVVITDAADVAIPATPVSYVSGDVPVGGVYHFTYSFTAPVGDYTACKVKVDLTDGAGNAATQAVLDPAFNIDNTNPLKSASVPADEATGVTKPSLTTLTYTFDENVMIGTGNIVIYHTPFVAPVETIDVTNASKVSVSGAVLTITPTFTGWTCGEHYYLEMDATAIDDLAGNSFAGINTDDDWDFTIEVTPVANAIVSTSPVCQGSTGNTYSVTTNNTASGATYAWSYSGSGATLSSTSGNAITINFANNATAGTLGVVETNATGCSFSNTTAIAVNPLPILVTHNPAAVCAPATVDLTLAAVTTGSTLNGGVLSYWTNAGATLALGAPAAVAASGTYYIKATNGCGAVIQPVVVTINPQPAATITAGGPTTFCTGGSVTLNANTGAGLTYQWKLNGGNIGGATSSSYVANASGNYTVVVTNATLCPTTSGITAVTVNALPVANTITGQASVCVSSGHVYSVTNNGNTYAWSYSPSADVTFSNATVINPTVNFGATAASGTLTCVETNGSGCTRTTTKSITVTPLLASNAITGTNTVCAGASTVAYSVTNHAGNTYLWAYSGSNAVITGGATSSITINYATNATSGDLTCTETTPSGCQTINTMSITVKPLPTATITGNATICSGSSTPLTVTFTGTSPYSITYFDGSNSTTVNGIVANSYIFSVSPATSRTYTVTSVSDAQSCPVAGTGSAVITVNPLPTATITPAGATTFCIGGSVTLNANVLAGHTYQWKLGGVDIGGQTATSFVASASGVYTVAVTTTATGCTAISSPVTVTVNPLPTPTITPGGPTTFCAGGSVTLTSSPASSYLWSNGATTQAITVSAANTYSVTVTDANGCVGTSAGTVVTVNALPVATITPGGLTTFCQGGSVTLTANASTSYLWSTGATTQAITVSTSGSYTVTVTNVNGCSITSAATVVTVNPLAGAAGTITGTALVPAGTNGVAYDVPAIANANTYGWSYTGTNVTFHNTTSNSITIDFASNATSGDLTVYGHNDCGNGTISAAYHITVSSSTPPQITGNPTPVTVCANATAQFSVTSVSGVPVPTLTWQVSTDGIGFTDIVGGDYTGINSTTLTITTLTGKNGYLYRLKADNTMPPTAYSNSAALTLTTPLVPSVAIAITSGTNPTCTGNSVTYTATPTNGGAPTYQWKVGGVNQPGQTASTFTYTPINGDAVTVVMTSTLPCVTTATATSNIITMTVNPNVAIGTDPVGTNLPAGSNYTFTVAATGTNLHYQWKHGVTNVGLDQNTLVLNNIQVADAGSYTVVVSGDCGAPQTSAAAVLTITAAPTKFLITTIPDQTSGTGFNVFVTSVDAGDNPQNVSTNTGFTLTVATGTGLLSGTVSGTILAGGSTANVNVSYTITGGETGVSLTATRTSGMTLTAGTSNTFNVMSEAPTTQASITKITVTTTTATLTIGAGNGNKRLVVIKAGNNAVLGNPADGVLYNANSTFGSGDQTAALSYVVMDANATTITISNLTRFKTYYTVAVYEYNWDGSHASTMNYNTSISSTNRKVFQTTLKQGTEETVVNNNKYSVSPISPNPVTTNVNFTVDAQEEAPYTIEIFSVDGQLVYTSSVNLGVGEHSFNINMSNEKGLLANGTYLLKVSALGETSVSKFVYLP